MYEKFRKSVITSILAGTVMGIGICPAIAGTNEFTDVSSGSYTVDSEVSGGSATNYYWPSANAVTNTGANVVLTTIADEITRSYTQSAGSLTVNGVSLINTSNITGGSLSLANLSTYTSQGAIASAVTVNVDGTSYLLVGTGGTVALNTGDTWTGNVTQTDGTLSVDGLSSNGVLTSTGGNLNIGTTSAATLDMIAGSSIASATTLNLASGSELDVSGGSVVFNTGDTLAGDVLLSSGSLTLDSIGTVSTSAAATYNQTGGSLTINNAGLTLNTSGGAITGGDVSLTNVGSLTVQNGLATNEAKVTTDTSANNFTIGDGTSATSFTLDGGSSIDANTNLNINTNSTLNLTEGSNTDTVAVNVNTGDVWNGTINLANQYATLNYNGLASNGALTASAGNLNIGNSSAATLNVGVGSSIASAVTTYLGAGSTMNVSGGTVSLNTGDTWAGTVNQTLGTLNYDGLASNGAFTSTGGSLNIGTTSAATLDIAAGSSIASATVINLASGSTIDLSGGTISFNTGDTWVGTVNQTLGTLNYDGLASNGTLTSTNGTINIGASTAATLDMAAGSSIASTTTVNLATDSTLGISGGTVNLNAGDTWAGSVNQSSGTLNYDGLASNGAYTGTGGSLNIGTTSAATLGIASGSSIASAVTTNLASGSTIALTGGTVSLNAGDTWAGTINQSSGTLNYDGLSSNGVYTATGGNLNIGATSAATLDIASGSSIAAAVTTNLASGSTLGISGGTVNLNAGDTWSGAIDQSSGTLNYDGLSSNGALTSTGGSLNIGTTTSGTLTITSGSSIDAATNVNLASGSTMILTGSGATPASLTLNSNTNDTWAGNIYLQDAGASTDTNAILTLNSGYNHTTTPTASYTQESGTLNIDGAGSGLTLATADSVISGGNVNLTNEGSLNLNNDSANTAVVTSNDSSNTTLGIGGSGTSLTLSSGSTIGESTKVTIGSDTTLNMTNSSTTVSLDAGAASADTWSGTINLNNTGATLNYDGLSSNGTINAQAGNLNIGTNSAATMTVGAGSEIADTAKTNLALNSTLNIQGTSAVNTGDVTFNGTNVGTDDIDTWSGDVNLSDYGKLTLDSFTHTASTTSGYTQTGGTLNLDNASSLTVGGTSSNSVTAGTNTQSIINVTGGSSIIFSNGAANEAVVNSNDASLNNVTLSQLASSATSLKMTGGTIDSATNVAVNSNTTLEISKNDTYGTSALVTLDATDTCDGTVSLTGGNLVLNGVSIATVPAAISGVHYYQSSGGVALENGTMASIYDGSAISGGSMLIDNTSALGISTNGMTLSGDLVTSGTISTLNGLYQTQTLGNNLVINNSSYTDAAGNVVTGDGQADFYVDFYARDKASGNYSSDTYQIAGLVTSTDIASSAIINVADWTLNGNLFGSDAPQDSSYDFTVFNAAGYNSNLVWANTVKEYDTPIGTYTLSPTGLGTYRLALSSFNAPVFRGQVSTVAQYANQLQVNNLLFDHVGLVNQSDFIASSDYANKYAAAYPQFAPYQYTKERGGLWYKTYGNFESIAMSQNLRVRNYAYGSLFGVDFPQTTMKNGWKFMPTAYGAYNFGHQVYDNVSMYQNGGQAGLMGTFSNDRYIGSLLGYVGGYGNDMQLPTGSHDEAGSWFAGVAHKSAYNIRLRDDLYLQPTVMLAYNAFGRQNWHTSYGDMSMASAMLNGFNAAPGLNLIWDKDTYSLYLTTQYVFNIGNGSEGMAGNVSLPGIKMDTFYAEYGLGVKKNVNDRFSLYAQGIGRAGARLGGAVQGGLDWRM